MSWNVGVWNPGWSKSADVCSHCDSEEKKDLCVHSSQRNRTEPRKCLIPTVHQSSRYQKRTEKGDKQPFHQTASCLPLFKVKQRCGYKQQCLWRAGVHCRQACFLSDATAQLVAASTFRASLWFWWSDAYEVVRLRQFGYTHFQKGRITPVPPALWLEGSFQEQHSDTKIDLRAENKQDVTLNGHNFTVSRKNQHSG